MNTRSTKSDGGGGQLLWWAAAGVVVAVVMALKPAGKLTVAEWKWALGVAGVVMLWRLWGLLRSSSSSPGRIVLCLLGAALVGSVGLLGVPAHWFRFPAWSEVSGVVLPMMLGVAALGAVLFCLAKLNRKREMDGGAQRSYVPLILNLIIVGSVWHVVRQPLWKQSLEGMMKLPQLHSNRLALEKTIAPLVDSLDPKNGDAAHDEAPAEPHVSIAGGAAPFDGDAGRRATDAPRSQTTGSGARTGAISASPMPANAEEWIHAAVHNSQDPHLELRACVALVSEGRVDQALSRLTAARDRGCQSPEVIRLHARLLRAKGRPAAAAAALEILATSTAGTNEDLQECLSAWDQAGQPDRASSLAEDLLVRNPSRELFRWVASRDAAAGRHDRALVLLGQLSRRSPFDPADAFQLADVALRAGRPELALDAVTLLEDAGYRSARTAQLAAHARASGIAESGRPRAATPTARGGGG